jgi:hypothetical protein
MDLPALRKKFARIGARLRLRELLPGRRPGSATIIDSGIARLNVVKDDQGEVFEIEATRKQPPELSVLDVQPADRHLLLLMRHSEGQKSKFLCGHDERHWFVAGIPESAPVGNVQQAKEALKPDEVQARQVGLKAKARSRRRNSAYVRQGEWFFVPAPDFEEPDALRVLRNEPLVRGRGKPHIAEFCSREGGETVYVCSQYPNGVDGIEYARIRKLERETRPVDRSHGWRVMRREAEVYVRGRVRHPDHKTVHLARWHRVLLNTESNSRAMRHVAFLD